MHERLLTEHWQQEVEITPRRPTTHCGRRPIHRGINDLMIERYSHTLPLRPPTGAVPNESGLEGAAAPGPMKYYSKVALLFRLRADRVEIAIDVARLEGR